METLNGHRIDIAVRPQQKEAELVSAKTLAAMWDVKLRTIREWVTLARNKPSESGIPFVQMPGSRLIRFPLKEVREWYGRGKSRNYF